MRMRDSHPQWCNRKHQPGANPNRQDHGFTWKTKHKSNLTRMKLYPCGPGVGHPAGGMFFHFVDQFGHEADAYLDVADAVAMADSILRLAGMVERGEVQ